MSRLVSPQSRSRLALFLIVTFGYAMVALGLVFFSHQIGLPAVRSAATFAALVSSFAIRTYLGCVRRKRPSDRISWRDWFVFALPAILIVRLVGIADEGILEEYGDWYSSLYVILLDMLTFVLILLMIGTWMTAASVAEQVDALHPQSIDARAAAQPELDTEASSGRERQNRGMAMMWLNRVGAGGAGILIVIAGILVAVPAYAGVPAAIPAGIVLVVLLFYFVTLLLLHSYASFVRRQTNWDLDRAPQSPGIAANWLRSTTLILGAGLLLVVFLPRFPAPDLSGGVRPLIAIAQVALALLTLPFIAIAYLLDLFFSLFRGDGEDGGGPIAPPPTSLFESEPGSDWLPFLQSAFLWFVLAVAAYLIFKRIRNRESRIQVLDPILVALAAIFRLPGLLLAVLGGFLRLAGDVAVEAAGATRAGWARLGRPLMARAPPVEPEPVTNRERVWRSYREVLQAAAVAGHERRSDQTADEFRRHLEPHLEESHPSLRAITGIFVQARYSTGDVDDDRVRRARENGDRVVQSLQQSGHAGSI